MIRAAVLVGLLVSACWGPSYSNRTVIEDNSSSSGGCKKGCRCGNSCIDCSKTCRGGETYRKRRR